MECIDYESTGVCHSNSILVLWFEFLGPTRFVDTINGVTIRSLGDVAAAFAQPAKHDVIMLEGIGLPIVLRRTDVLSANPRIMKNYGIASDRNL